jgi:hypothetical protein
LTVYTKVLTPPNSLDSPRNGGYPPVPLAFHGLTCGAKTRAGTPCKRIDLYWNGRCKFHGGLSTGPHTEAGKAQARENGKLGGRDHHRNPNPMGTLTKPMGTLTKPYVLASESSRVIVDEGGNAHGQNQMPPARFHRGPSSFRSGGVQTAKTDEFEPNPMDGPERLRLHGEETARSERTSDLIKPEIPIVRTTNVSVQIQCKNCANLSAGFRCLAPGSGETFPAAGELRICASFCSAG